MNLAKIYHREAVHFAEQAEIAKIKQPDVDYKELYFKAYLSEKNAALHQHTETFDPMPKTWLMQSAAALAYNSGRLEEAEKTIAFCRTLDPDEYTTAKLDKIECLLKETANGHAQKGSLEITGRITSANYDEKEIKIKDSKTHQTYPIIVPHSMFTEVVKSYWAEMVNAVAKVSSHGVFTLQKISKAA